MLYFIWTADSQRTFTTYFFVYVGSIATQIILIGTLLASVTSRFVFNPIPTSTHEWYGLHSWEDRKKSTILIPPEAKKALDQRVSCRDICRVPYFFVRPGEEQ